MLLTRPPLTLRFVRLACVKHAASVHPEPEEVDIAGAKCIYFNKLKRSWPHPIPIFVSTNAMLYGAEKQAIIQLAGKVVYYTATVYNQEAKEIGG